MKQKGFASVILFLGLLFVGLSGYMGWQLYSKKNAQKTPDIQQPTNSPQPSYTSDGASPNHNTATPTNTTACASNGRVIVMFNMDVPKDRTKQILADQNASIVREYESFNGYTVSVGQGKEQAAKDAFMGYKEVKSASFDCPDESGTN